jgi:hypothetical protein
MINPLAMVVQQSDYEQHINPGILKRKSASNMIPIVVLLPVSKLFWMV